MATTLVPQLRETDTLGIPLRLLPQALSLDAPLVAALWMWFFARSVGAPLPVEATLVLAAVVWMIYALDHILDVLAGAGLSCRHSFVGRHLRGFSVAFLLVLIACGYLVTRLPRELTLHGALLSIGVGIYFAAVHLGGERLRVLWPKEVVMGAVFAAGCSLPVWQHGERAWPGIAMFAGLCTLNCAALDHWEWQSNAAAKVPQLATRFLGRHDSFLTALLCVAATLSFIASQRPLFLMLALSALGLLIVTLVRRSMQVETARMIADVALLTPILLLAR